MFSPYSTNHIFSLNYTDYQSEFRFTATATGMVHLVHFIYSQMNHISYRLILNVDSQHQQGNWYHFIKDVSVSKNVFNVGLIPG